MWQQQKMFFALNFGDLTLIHTDSHFKNGHITAPKAICKWHIMSFQPKNLFAHRSKRSLKK